MPEVPHPLALSLITFHQALVYTSKNPPPFPDIAATTLHEVALCCQKLAREMSDARSENSDYVINAAVEVREILMHPLMYNPHHGEDIASLFRRSAAMLLNVADQLDPDDD